MTINGSNNMTMRDTLGHKVDHRSKGVYSNKGDYWSSMKVCATELNVAPATVSLCCSGKTRTCKGLELIKEEDVQKSQRAMARALRERVEKQTALEQKANAYDELKSQLAEHDQLKDELTKANEELTAYRAYKAHKEKVEELKRTVWELEGAYYKAKDELNDAMRELNKLAETL